MNSSNETASRMERFDLLYHTLIQYNERFIKSSISLAGVLMVLIGWLLTSSSAKTFFASSITGTVATLVIIVVLIVIYWYSITRVYEINIKVFQQLKKLDYVEDTFYSYYFLPVSYKYIGIGLNVCIYLIFSGLVINAHYPFLSIKADF